MTFLAPFAWSLLAFAAPIIALYLIKTRLRRRAVTTLLFWEQLRPPVYSHSLWRKLRRWLSLLLQIAFLALLAFALARPLASWENAGRRATVIVLDPSPSMLATDLAPDRWTHALDEAHRRVGTLRFLRSVRSHPSRTTAARAQPLDRQPSRSRPCARWHQKRPATHHARGHRGRAHPGASARRRPARARGSLF